MADETFELLDFLQNQLVETQDRATTSERALLQLRLEVFNNAMNDLKASAKRDLLIKYEIYKEFPGKVSQAQREYESTIRDIDREVTTNQEIYNLFFDALNKGLTLKDLPLSMVDKPISEVESFIDVCVIEKKKKENQSNRSWSVLRDLFVLHSGITRGTVSPTKHQDLEAEMLRVVPEMPSQPNTATYPGMNNITEMKKEIKGTTVSDAGETEDPNPITVTKETRDYVDSNAKSEKGKLLEVTGVEEQFANWSREPYSLMVDRLGKQFKNKIGKTLAVEMLKKAAKEVGDLKKLDDIYARGMQICQVILQPEKTTPENATAVAPTPAKPSESLRSSIQFARMCRFFITYNTCRYGNECVYAHTEQELQAFQQANVENDSRPNAQNIHAPHKEPCNNQDCQLKLKYLKKLTQMCPQVERGWLCKNQTCLYAHRKQELRPMPKWELCERFRTGRCRYQHESEKCVYAHSEAELREKPANLVQLSESPANSPRYTQEESKEVGQCFICCQYLYVSQRPPALRCGHDDFHRECLHVWKEGKNTNCPRCGVVM